MINTKIWMWPFLALASFVFTAFAMLFSWFFVFFINDEGYFPKSLSWLQTSDSNMDGCYGDLGFCEQYKNSNKLWRRILWQLRNPASGFSDMLGVNFINPEWKTWGNLAANRLPNFIPGWYLILVKDVEGRTAFEFGATFATFPTKCMNIRCGWKLGNLFRDKTERIPVVSRAFWPLYARGK